MTDAPAGCRPAVKICGIMRPGDARAAEAAGASFVGAVLVPASPRRVDATGARSIGENISLPLAIVVANLHVSEVARAARESGARVIQLHGDEPVSDIEALREEGEWEIWKAVRIRIAEELPAAINLYASFVDGLLLDGWHPRHLGGAGARFPWEEVARHREEVPSGMKLIIAGGLSSENVREAVTMLRPDVVDTSSGVESAPGIKDHERIHAFIAEARRSLLL